MLFGGLIAALSEAARAIIDKPLPDTEKEREMWKECGCVLAEELKKAAAKTETISSIPAFLASHLRRRFARDVRNVPAAAPVNVSRQSEGEQKAEGGNQPSTRSAQAHTSKFSLDECRRYAEHLQKSGQGITNPGGYATTIFRTGEADVLIEEFLNPGSVANLDSGRCPDCRGMGYFYPEGLERGAVARCKHPRLTNAVQLEEQFNHLRQLHSGDAGYQQADLLDDLKFRCEREKITWDEELINRLLEEGYAE
jgi:hypothetical protein